jgi:peptidoglycan/xylan/chitin deacetylase (PgdA/CDA1 family)
MMFILGSSSSFPNTARSKLSHVSKIATATINLISVGGPHSIFNAASNPTISTGQFSSVTSNSHVKSNDKSNNNKVIVLSFDDNRIGDFTYAKPILDKYGFKATFFVICGKKLTVEL